MNDIDHTWWFLTRSSGLVAYLLLFACVSLGLSMTGRGVENLVRRYRLYDLHRFLGLLALMVTTFHAFIVLPDEYIGFRVQELLVPFLSPYRPGYMAAGVFAFYATAIVVASFYVRRLMPYRAWRLVHYATFGAFALALAHGIGAGTDTEAAWARLLYAATGVVVFNLLVYRLLRGAALGLPPEAASTRGGRGRALGAINAGGRREA